MMKSASVDPAKQALLLAQAEAITKGIDPSTVTVPEVSVVTDTFTKSADEIDLSDPVAFAKALSGLPENLREAFIKQREELTQVGTQAHELFEKAQTDKFEKMARECINLPGVVPSEFAKSLRAASEAAPEAFTKVFDVLKAADGAIKQSGLYKEIGTGIETEGGKGDLESVVKALQAADKELSYEDAVVKAVTENPSLYNDHRAANLNTGGKE